jgi:hypothetical protein
LFCAEVNRYLPIIINDFEHAGITVAGRRRATAWRMSRRQIEEEG